MCTHLNARNHLSTPQTQSLDFLYVYTINECMNEAVWMETYEYPVMGNENMNVEMNNVIMINN